MPVLTLAPALIATAIVAADDPRNIRGGWTIPDEGYCDQPYVVATDDGHWLCVMTTGQGVEGQAGQHVVATRSGDRGKTWSPLVAIEPAGGPEASWVMPLKVPGGRVYVFYTYNAQNLRAVPGSNSPAASRRVDTLGQYAFRYTDDHGRSWSGERYEIPVREMRIDRENQTGGKVRFFWGVGKPIVARGGAVFGFAKVGKWGAPGTMVTSQSCFLRSDNILTEPDPGKLRWETLPAGDEGLRAPKGPVADEANLVELSDGSFYATYRTIDGYNGQAYSRDGGRTWTGPEYATHTPGGRRLKHPRAANFVRKFKNGKYLLWFHNHAGEAVHLGSWAYYNGRNPAWVCGGIEKDGFLYWSEPEILVYDPDPAVRISYPDFVEEGDGRVYVTETQKTVARVHEVDRRLLEGMWGQFGAGGMTRDGLALELKGWIGLNTGETRDADGKANAVRMPVLPDLRGGGGFTLEFWVNFRELTEGQTLLDTRDDTGKGVRVVTSDRSTIRLTLGDGKTETSWDSDPGTHPGTLKVGDWQHVVVVVDGGPKIITFVVDGVLNDGGPVRDYGWGRFHSELGDVNGEGHPVLAEGPQERLWMSVLRVYNRALRTSEAVGNFRAGMDETR
jgi:hypothetical protein